MLILKQPIFRMPMPCISLCTTNVTLTTKQNPFDKDVLKTYLSRLLAVLLFSLILCSCNSDIRTPPTAKKGVIDLRHWNFEKDGNLTLDGQWEFYWQKFLSPHDFEAPNRLPEKYLVKVPGKWNDSENKNTSVAHLGYATYRLRVLLPKTLGTKLGMKIAWLNTSARMFVNDRQILQLGTPGTTKTETKPESHPRIIRIYSEHSEVTLLIQIANFHHRKSGIMHSLTLGKQQQIRQNHLQKMLYNMFLVGIILFVGLYHLSLFWLRRKNLAVLYFGILCIILSIRNLATNKILMEIAPVPWQVLIKMEYLGFYASIGVSILYIRAIFPKEIHRIVTHIILWVSGTGTFLVLLTSPLWFTHTLEFFQITIIIVILYLMYVVLAANFRGRKEARMFLIGGLVLFVTIINDMLFVNRLLNIGYLLPIGFAAFILSQSYLLAILYSQAFKQTEQLTNELAAQNNLINLLLNENQHRVGNDFVAVYAKVAAIDNAQSGEEAQQLAAQAKVRINEAMELQNLLRYPFHAEEQSLDQAAIEAKLHAIAHTLYNIHFQETDQHTITICNEVNFLNQNRFVLIGFCVFELVKNTCKHAFRGKAADYPATIELNLSEVRGIVTLRLQNNGKSLNPELFDETREFNFKKHKVSKGMSIVQSITTREKGSFITRTTGVHPEIKKGSVFVCTFGV